MLFKKKMLQKLGYVCCALLSFGNVDTSSLSKIGIFYNFPAVLICELDSFGLENECKCEETFDAQKVQLNNSNVKSLQINNIVEKESAVEFEQNKIKFRVLSDSTVSVIGFDSSISSSLFIPNEAFYENKSYKVTKIDDNSFKNCENLQLIVIPDTILAIGDNAFTGCSSLRNMVFENGSSLETIGDYAFEGTSVVSLSLPKSLNSVGRSSFEDCSNLKFVSIENPNLSLGMHCFSGCSSLQTISAPCIFNKESLQRTGVNLDPESLDFKVVKYSFSKWGLIMEKEIGEGRLVLNHDCSDCCEVEGTSEMMCRCNSCNFAKIIESAEQEKEELIENQISI